MRENRKLLILFVVCIVLLMLSFGGKQQNDPQVTYEFTVDSDTYTDLSQVSTEGLPFYDSMEEAIKNANPKMFEGFEYAREVDTQIKMFESDTGIILFYEAYETSKNGRFVVARFEKRTAGNKDEYGLVSISPSEIEKGGFGYDKNPEKNVRFSIQSSQVRNMLGYTLDGEKRFVWGITKLPEVQNVIIEGQKPDEVIAYKQFDEDWYFWYYTDLQSDKTIDELNIEFVE